MKHNFFLSISYRCWCITFFYLFYPSERYLYKHCTFTKVILIYLYFPLLVYIFFQQCMNAYRSK